MDYDLRKIIDHITKNIAKQMIVNLFRSAVQLLFMKGTLKQLESKKSLKVVKKRSLSFKESAKMSLIDKVNTQELMDPGQTTNIQCKYEGSSK
jgi:hypothetical protein